jgi:hypothetical protein
MALVSPLGEEGAHRVTCPAPALGEIALGREQLAALQRDHDASDPYAALTARCTADQVHHGLVRGERARLAPERIQERLRATVGLTHRNASGNLIDVATTPAPV